MPGRLTRPGGAGLLAACLATLPAAAQEDPAGPATYEPPQRARVVHSIAGGVLAHDYGVFSSHEEDGADVNLEIQFTGPRWREWRWIGSPRVMLGGNINTAGDTSRVYGGLYWDWYPVDDRWFLAGALGLTLHNGETEEDVPGRRNLGAPVLFHIAAETGIRFTEHHAVSVYADHASHGGLFDDDNGGLEAVGLRYRYSFAGP
jgi:hypothetical protein